MKEGQTMKSGELKLTESIKCSPQIFDLITGSKYLLIAFMVVLHQLVCCGNYDYDKIKLALASISASYKALTSQFI